MATLIRRRSGRRFNPNFRKQGGNVVTYFLTPEMEVLTFLVGPVSPGQVQEAAEWSKKQIADMKGMSPEAQRVHMRQAHQARIPQMAERFIQLGEQQFGHNQHLGDLQRYVAMMKGVSIQLLRNNRTIPELQEETNKINRERGRHQNRQADLVLSRLPLAKVSQIEKPVFERLAGERFQQRTKRNQDLLLLAESAQDNNLPVLAIVDPSAAQMKEAAYANKGQLNKLLPKHIEVRRQMDRFATLILTYQEATLLADDLGNEPLVGMPKMIIFDKTGATVACLSGSRRGYSLVSTKINTGKKLERFAGSLLSKAMKVALNEEFDESKAKPHLYRRFESSNGSHSVNAALLTVIGDRVTLKTKDGRHIKVSLSQLSERDVKYIERHRNKSQAGIAP